MAICRILFLTILLLTTCQAQAEEYVLPPIIKDASPVDSLGDDLIVHSHHAQTGVSGASGSVQTDLEDALPLSVTDSGRPGSLAQLRGLGRSAEDINVQSLGISLNPPQGGGFDLSSFPQFFWSEYRFSLSPSLSAFDPRGVSGNLSLKPWTENALESAGDQTRWTALYAGSNLQQVSVATKYGARAAILAGNSSGLANGPSGSVSARVVDTDKLSVKLHVLGTRIDSQLYNFGFGQSPHQITERVIPVGQLDWFPTKDVVVKSSLFYDNTYIRYDDSTNQLFTRDRAQQLGTENAVLIDDWKFGAGSRSVSYQLTGFQAPHETVTNASISHLWKWETSVTDPGDKFILSPTLEWVSVSNFTSSPQASLGIRQEWNDSAFATYLRGTYSRRFPSLLDRYYNVPAGTFGVAILGNPALQPENDYTYLVGAEAKGEIWNGSLEGYYQIRDNAEVAVITPTLLTNANLGQARVFSVTATGSVQIIPMVKLSDSANFTRSRVDALQSPFPYIPNFLNVAGVELVPFTHLTFGVDIRTASTEFISSSSGSLPRTTFADVQANYAFSKDLQVIGRVENVTDNNVVLSQGFPPKERVFALSVIGTI